MLQETDDTAAYPAFDVKSWDFNPAEQRLLDSVNQRIAAGQNLAEVLNYLFDSTREICPCDRIGVAFWMKPGNGYPPIGTGRFTPRSGWTKGTPRIWPAVR
jgi:hypothetical protein